MMTYRVFVNENGQNFVGFRYKVDGMLCSRRQSAVNACTNGLNFFIDGEKRLHSDLQFKWVSVKFNLTKVRIVYSEDDTLSGIR